MSDEIPIPKKTIIPLHQWTYTGDRVLLVRCGDVGYEGFQWPKSGPVKPLQCSREPNCASGGLFGWPWGVNIGGGKDPDYRKPWLVFSAPANQVIDLSDKAKVAMDSPDLVNCEVVYHGDISGALMLTLAGRIAWVEQNSSGSSISTGWRGSASSTDWSGSAISTGLMGSSISTGERGSSISTGRSGSSISTGESGSSISTGLIGSAISTGLMGSASSTGEMGSASSTGLMGSASSTGWRGSASSTGESGVAAVTGDFSTIEVGRSGLGAVTANSWFWLVRRGSVVACRWKDGDSWCQRLLVADELNLNDGDIVQISNGEITR